MLLKKARMKVFSTLGTAVFMAGTLFLAACSGENGVDGRDGKDAEEVNVDSLANVLREEITGTLWDSLYAKPYVDTVYQILFDNAFAESWMDSVRDALIDSLKQADYDSLYNKLYDSVYADIYSQNVIKSLDAWIWSNKEDIYGAFAPQYPLMYKDHKNAKGESAPVPISVKARSQCTSTIAYQCRWTRVMLKAWIPGITDTASVTEILNPNTTITLAPTFNYDIEALAAVTSPTKTQIQLRAYALENDHEILFYSESKDITLHPMEVYGAEYTSAAHMNWWYAAWVTPNMDSITAIHKELEKVLPGGNVMAYQLYEGDPDMVTSSARLVKAIYDIIAAKGINYVNNTKAASNGQKIKYPVQVLREGQANCIEAVNLFASIMESLGMHTLMVIIPGHAFVGWYTDSEKTNYNFLETTMALGEAADFMTAYKAGVDAFNNEVALENFKNGKSHIIDLDEARLYGIMPNNVP